jgi:lysyl-tRNA synthetase class 2
MLNDEDKKNWRPTASLQNLQKRAAILAKIRHFFAERSILEVETPLLCQFGVTDPYIQSFAVPAQDGVRYLQTSPEYAMKRLLAADSGSIYQICKAFRVEENGQWHNSEFSILEWYRIDFNHHDLMQEVAEFLKSVLDFRPAKYFRYAELFQRYLSLDIFTISDNQLREKIHSLGWLQTPLEKLDRDTCLQLLMTHAIEPHLGQEQPAFVYDFPASQAALARINLSTPPVAERFELYIQGLEIANGFHELKNAEEQKHRFLQNQNVRRKDQTPVLDIDTYFIAALKHGLPDCAGVALGLDRLMMLAGKTDHIQNVLAFSWERS